ncbi:MAG: 2-amino-4-hydroxy-6-hydroxymethyldihydropteridine diphosphokinase [Bacteroidetes bacterium]|nr:2-amino-4-hydroxy-6-hydroxymethyldihydropteridine diphosphokinase [Bacteroidota bacterium]
MNKAYLLLGSNLGERENYLLDAKAQVKKNIGKIISESSLYNTAAWGKESQNDFLNQVISVETNLPAEKLLEAILSIEKKMGRERNKKWEARIIDIDILFFNDEIIRTKNLTVPHPHLHERRFALVPLAEIAADFIHPVLKKSIKSLLRECKDNLEVKILPIIK